MREIIEIEIRDINNQGNGVGELDNLVYFVEKGVLGEICKAEVTKKKKNYALAKKIETVKESPYAEKPKCKYFGECSGCSLQNVNYKAQIELKKKAVKEKLERLADEKIENLEIISMENPYNYRNKIELKVNDNSKLGYYGRNTHRHVEIDECIIASEAINNVIPKIQEILDKYKIPGYRHRTNDGIIKNITIRGNYAGEIQLTITFAKNRFRNQNGFLDNLKEISEISQIYVSINDKKRDENMGEKVTLIYEKNIFIDKIGEYKFIISPKSFFQINMVNTEKLYQEAINQMKSEKNEKILDLYSGIGTIPIFISKNVKKIDGVEIVRDAVKDAKQNMAINMIQNVNIETGKSEENIQKLIENNDYTTVIVDPPRKGLDEIVIENISNSSIKKVEYISCDPATLARDIKLFKQNGFKLSQIKACDMFPQTVHVECIVLLQR